MHRVPFLQHVRGRRLHLHVQRWLHGEWKRCQPSVQRCVIDSILPPVRRGLSLLLTSRILRQGLNPSNSLPGWTDERRWRCLHGYVEDYGGRTNSWFVRPKVVSLINHPMGYARLCESFAFH